ncbi:MAG: carbohydrate kinase family protein [Methanomicrobiaceae archaeon]|nr:carbohydrate kinase family protein [Methanomicrobiaceae archaeon]
MITVVGHTAIDHICKVPVFPERHGSVPVVDHKIYYGGGAANIAAGIARLGGKCELLSAVGDDFEGSDYDEWMSSIGVQKRFIVVNGKRTATCFLFNDEAGDQMTFFEWGASTGFTDSDPPSLEFVHMATADPTYNVKVAEKAEFSSFDPGQDLINYSKEQLETIIDNIDILFANHHEVRRMTEMLKVSEDDLIEKIPVSIITMSGDGSEIHTDGRIYKIPVVPVKLADPTGAGDAYRAGFLTAYQTGYDILTCCKIGTVSASFTVEVIGCQTNLPDWKIMSARYGENFGQLESPNVE